MEVREHNSGFGPQAGSFPAPGAAWLALLLAEAKSAPAPHGASPRNSLCQPAACYLPRSRSSISAVAKPSAGAPIAAWNERSACLVSPPNWPSGVPR